MIVGVGWKLDAELSVAFVVTLVLPHYTDISLASVMHCCRSLEEAHLF